LLAVDKDEVGIKVVGDVAADFKNRIGEVTGRRSTRFIAVLLTCERRSLEEELERATEQSRQVSAAMGLTGSVLMFGEVPEKGWALRRVLDIGSVSPETERLVASLSLSGDIIQRLPLQSQAPGPLVPGDAWLEFTRVGHEHGGQGWEFGTCL